MALEERLCVDCCRLKGPGTAKCLLSMYPKVHFGYRLLPSPGFLLTSVPLREQRQEISKFGMRLSPGTFGLGIQPAHCSPRTKGRKGPLRRWRPTSERNRS